MVRALRAQALLELHGSLHRPLRMILTWDGHTKQRHKAVVKKGLYIATTVLHCLLRLLEKAMHQAVQGYRIQAGGKYRGVGEGTAEHGDLPPCPVSHGYGSTRALRGFVQIPGGQEKAWTCSGGAQGLAQVLERGSTR
jgi:hypothetical protein